MQVTGYMIREALKRQEIRRSTLAIQAKSSLWQFPGDEKMSADEVMAQLRVAEEAIAALQVLQDRYNLMVEVEVNGVKLSLSQAIKTVGGAGRVEKQWRDFATDTGKRGYQDESLSRDKDEERAVRTLSPKECLMRSTQAANYAGSLRAVIAEGNSKKVNFDGLDTLLFE
jgi:hypothetical protein